MVVISRAGEGIKRRCRRCGRGRRRRRGGRSCFDFRLRRMNICSTRPSGPCAATLPINTALYACWLSGPPTTDNRKETPEKLLCLAPSPPLFASFLPLSLYLTYPLPSLFALILAATQRNSGGPRRSSLAIAITFPRIIINPRHLRCRRRPSTRILATISPPWNTKKTSNRRQVRARCPLLANNGPRRLVDGELVGRGRRRMKCTLRGRRKIDIGRRN